MTKAELLERIDSAEITEWIAEFKIRTVEYNQKLAEMKSQAKLRGRRK